MNAGARCRAANHRPGPPALVDPSIDLKPEIVGRRMGRALRREQEIEARPDPRLAADADIAADRPHEGANLRDTEPGAGIALGSEIRVEDSPHGFRGHALSLIADADAQPDVTPFRRARRAGRRAYPDL